MLSYQRGYSGPNQYPIQQTLNSVFLQHGIKRAALYYLHSLAKVSMKEGDYWIQHVRGVQIANRTNDTLDDPETVKPVAIHNHKCLVSDNKR